MASAEVSGVRRRKVAPGLAGIVVLLALLLAGVLLITGGFVARADGPVVTLSTSTTNPGGELFVNGTGWAPAKHYNLYVYSQKLCPSGQPTCPVPSPASKYLITTSPVPINRDGTFSFDFTFSTRAAPITYVFTVIADYPADTPYTASTYEQVVPAGTPPSGTPISSSPSPSPTVGVTTTPVVTATTAVNPGGDNGGQNNTPQQSGSNSTVLIGVVGFLLFVMIVVLIALLIILPPKRRAIRAAYYGSQDGGSQDYAAPGVRSRRTTGGYQPIEPEQPWQGGVAQWDDQPRPPRGSGPAARDRYTQRPPPRRPTDRDY